VLRLELQTARDECKGHLKPLNLGRNQYVFPVETAVPHEELLELEKELFNKNLLRIKDELDSDMKHYHRHPGRRCLLRKLRRDRADVKAPSGV
jgi:hypothetical protein